MEVMAQMRSRGMFFIGLGFVLTAMVGVWLASQDFEFERVLLIGVVAFAVIFPVFLYGSYLYSKEDVANEDELSSMALQRALVDTLNQHGVVSFDVLAEELEISRAQVTDLIRQLIELDVFPGWVDWEEGMAYAAANL